MNKGIFDINPPSYTYAFGQVPLNNNALVQMPFGFSNTIQTQTPNPQPVSTYPMPLGLPALNKDDEMVFVIDTTLGPGGATPDFGVAPNNGTFGGGSGAGSINISIDWGDGNTVTFTGAPGSGGSIDGVGNTTGYYAHTYANHGVYVVRIRGGYMGGIGPVSDSAIWSSKVVRWISFGDNLGTILVSTAHSIVFPGGMANLIELPRYLPTSVTQLCLGSCPGLTTNADYINDWDTSRVTSMARCFLGSYNFNSRLDRWDVSNVTDMSQFFQGYNGPSKFNQDISNWNVGKVTNMDTMFSTDFNQPIDKWNVSSVTNMRNMFGQSNFNQPIGNWNVSNVTNMNQMFNQTFNQDIGNWNVSKVTDMSYMFQFANSKFNQNISGWNLAGLNATTSLDNFMAGVTLSTANYDALLIGWNNNKLVAANGVANWRTDLRPNFGNSKYSTAAAAARAALVAYGWTITDGGPA